MASSDAKPLPRKNVAYRVTFPIFDASGNLVTGATGLDSEISKDGGTFADCTNEATEIATSSGIYFLDLTSTEMNADTVAIIVKTTSAGAKTTPIIMYPEESGDIRVNVDSFTNGAITAAAYTGSAITASVLAADVFTDMANAVWDENAAGHEYDRMLWNAIVAATASTYGVADSGTTTTLVDNALTQVDDYWNGYKLFLVEYATEVLVTDFVASTDTITFGSTLPDPVFNGLRYILVPPGINEPLPSVSSIADAVWDEARSGHVGAGSFGEGVVVNSIASNAITSTAIASNAITSAKIATDAIGAAQIAADAIGSSELAASAVTEIQSGLSTLTAAQVNAEVDTAIADARLDELLAADSDIDGAAPPTVGSVFHELLTKTAGSFTYDQTTDSLEALRDNLATASALSTLQTSVNTIDDFLDTEIADILADTNELQTDWTNGGRLDLLVDAIKAKTDNLPADPADASDIASSFSTVNTKLDTIDDFLDTEIAAILADTNELQTDWTNGGRLDLLIDAIKAKTDNLPADPADASDIAALFATVNTKLDTIDDFLDTEVAAILADTNELQTDWVDGGRLDLILDARASQASVDAVDDYIDTEIAAIKAKTDQLTFTVANQIDANDIDRTGYALTTTEHTNIADALLKRDWTAVGGTAARSVLNALRFLRNRRRIVAGVLNVTEEDDTTIAWSANLTTDSNAAPITDIEPT